MCIFSDATSEKGVELGVFINKLNGVKNAFFLHFRSHVFFCPSCSDVDIEAQFSLNQSRAEEITMREDYGSMALVTNDDGFGDMGFDTEAPDLMRHASGLEPSIEQVYLF